MKSSSQTSSYKSSSNKMGTMKMDALNLLPHGKTVVPEDLIKLSHQDIQHIAGDNSQDKLRYSFDVTQAQNESVVMKSDGSNVEMMKLVKSTAEFMIFHKVPISKL